MSLIPCRECGEQISELAKTCPKCGCPVVAPPKPPRPRMVAAIVAIVAALVGLGVGLSGGALVGHAQALVGSPPVGLGPVAGCAITLIAVVACIVAVVRRNVRRMLILSVIATLIALTVTGIGTAHAVIAVRATAHQAKVMSALRNTWTACTMHWGKQRQQWPATLADAIAVAPVKGAVAAHPITGKADDLLYIRPSDHALNEAYRPFIVENPAANPHGQMTVVYADQAIDTVRAEMAMPIWNALRALMATDEAQQRGVTSQQIEAVLAPVVKGGAK